MDNNQNDRKNINLSRDGTAEGIREAYPVYRSDISEAELQRQEYRNNKNAPFMEPEYENEINIPPLQPAAGNPPAAFTNDQFEKYYNYSEPQVSRPQNDFQQRGYSGSYAPNQPAGRYRQMPQYNTQPPQYNNPAPFNGQPQFAPQQPAMQTVKYCKFCGKQTVVDAIVCPHCGRQIEELKNPANGNINIYTAPQQNANNNPYGASLSSKKSKTTALILALLGFFFLAGLHRIYSGKILSGLLYLFTGGLGFVGTIYDIYKIATNTFTDKEGYIIKDN